MPLAGCLAFCNMSRQSPLDISKVCDYLYETRVPRWVHRRPRFVGEGGFQKIWVPVEWQPPSYNGEEQHAQAVDVRLFC